MNAPLTPRADQQDAIDAAAAHLSSTDRTQLHVACGAGKTLVGYWTARRLHAHRVLITVPSLNLVAQTLAVWAAQPDFDFDAVVVCSDPSAAEHAQEVGDDGIDPFGDRDPLVSTRPGAIAGRLDAATGNVLVISTYHSTSMIAEALAHTPGFRFDLAICDEAHHLAGDSSAMFRVVLDDTRIRCTKRLFLTATPVLRTPTATSNGLGWDDLDLVTGAAAAAPLSMDDHVTFGPVAHTFGFGDAIGAGILADYQILVAAEQRTATGPAEVTRELADVALTALVDAATHHHLHRVLSFHNSVERAHAFARAVTALGHLPDGTPVRGVAVDGTMSQAQRQAALSLLSDPDSDRYLTVVASSQCLREGVNIPHIDGALFADPRSSIVGIVQAVGRALRTAPGKTRGTIIVPIVLPDDINADDIDDIGRSRFRHVGRVLRALRAHDSRLATVIATHAPRGGDRSGNRHGPRIELIGGDPQLLDAVFTRVLRAASPQWHGMLDVIRAETTRLGSAAHISTTHVAHGRPIGGWLATQRSDYNAGRLDPDRAALLEALPGWTWDGLQASTVRTIALIATIATDHGGTLPAETLTTDPFAGQSCALNRPLSLWVAQTRHSHWRGDLSADTIRALEQIPGWSFTPDVLTADTDLLVALAQFCAWEQSTDVPAEHTEDGQPIGAYVRDVRRRKLTGRLAPALEWALRAGGVQDRTRGWVFGWAKPDTQWRLAIDALEQYVARTGSATPMPTGHTEHVGPDACNLYQWVAATRHAHRRGNIPADRVAALEQIPGWQWSGTAAKTPTSAPLDLGDIPHGRRGRYAGCRCTTCVQTSTEINTAWSRSRKQGFRSQFWTPQPDAARAVQALLADPTEVAGSKVTTERAVAEAAQVASFTVRSLANADPDDPQTCLCPAWAAQRLLSLDVNAVLAARSVTRSRGRLGLPGATPVDPQPVWERLDRLTAAGWSADHLAAALGYSSASLMKHQRDTMTLAQANVITAMLDSMGEHTLELPAAA